MPRPWVHLTSGTISRVRYDESTETLELEFHRSLYQYFDVPEAIFDQLIRADSAGRYFNEHIRDVYRFRQLRS